MSSILDMLTQQLGGDTMKQLSRQLGSDEKTTGAATGAALTAILGAISRNTSRPEGAESLHRALAKDHDGGVLDNLAGLLGNPEAGAGDGILRHVLGGKRRLVEQGLSRSTGLDGDASGRLMTLLAPMVMGALGKQQRESNMSAGDMASFLGSQQGEIERREPQAAGLMGQLLDADGDGDVDLGDIAKRGAGLFGKLFKQ